MKPSCQRSLAGLMISTVVVTTMACSTSEAVVDPVASDPLASWADGLPNTPFGSFPQSLMDEAKTRGWVVISMKNDWKEMFSS